MLNFSPALLRSFIVFDVVDPEELGAESLISRRFPSYNNFNTYRLRKPSIAASRPHGLLSRLAVRRGGALTVSDIGSYFGTDVGIDGAGVQRLFLTFSLDGAIALQPGHTDEAVATGSSGLVYRGLAGTCLLTSDDNQRMSIQIDEARLLRILEALLDEACPDCPTFKPAVNWADPAHAPIARMAQHLVEEAGEPEGLFSVPLALETFTDALVHLVLARLPHSYSERLMTPRSPAVPRQLRRAEEFIVAHAGDAISIADVAAAAGCSTRALQLAFRQFRETTPLAFLHEVRLQAVRAALSASPAPASVIARNFGFSNGARFRASYLRRFGQLPPKSR